MSMSAGWCRCWEAISVGSMPREREVPTGTFLTFETPPSRLYWIVPKLSRGTKHKAVGKKINSNAWSCCATIIFQRLLSPKFDYLVNGDLFRLEVFD